MNTATLVSPAQAEPLAPVLDTVIRQHAEEAAMLRHQRTALVRAPHIGLLMLGRHDERLAAHLDGLATAGAAGATHCAAVLGEGIEGAAAGEAFALGVALLDAGNTSGLEELAAAAGERVDLARGLASALGWVSADALRGVVHPWLGSDRPVKRVCGLAACAMHRVDAGPAVLRSLEHGDAAVRAMALRTAGRLGRVDLLGAVGAAIGDGDAEVAFWAAWAACRLGERAASTQALASAVMSGSAHADRALDLLMCGLPHAMAQELARAVSGQASAQGTPGAQRRLMRAIGLLGETRLVPWLIERMNDPVLSRAAGEAFCLITGADLAAQQLERLEPPPPAAAKPGAPAEGHADAANATDDDPIELDPDRDLPWPDAERVARWWRQQPLANAPTSSRLFLGRPSAEPAWAYALREGNQRQRAFAALLLAASQPSLRLFPVAAPAWRQRRWLAAG